jgi:hypothetical protein
MAGTPSLYAFLGHAIEPVQAHAPNAGHGSHVFDPVFPVQHEHRQDQVGGSQGVLAHQAARELIAAHAPHALMGKTRQIEHDDGLLKRKYQLAQCPAREPSSRGHLYWADESLRLPLLLPERVP